MRFNKKVIKIVAVGLTLGLSLMMAGVVLAASSVNITSSTGDADCSDHEVNGSIYNNVASDDLHFLIENVTDGTSTSGSFNNFVSTYSGSCIICGPLPGGSGPGDIIRITMTWKNDALTVLSQDSIMFECSTGNIVGGGAGGACSDGRVNENCAAPTIVYCSEDTVKFYKMGVDEGGNPEGYLAYSVPRASLLSSVSVKTLIKQSGQDKVYLLPDGRVLLIARQSDGKDYFMYFDPAECNSLQEGAEWGVK